MTEVSPATFPALVDPAERGARLAFARHAELLAEGVPPGPRDTLSVTEVVALLPTTPGWPSSSDPGSAGFRREHTAGARTILRWLASHPGDGWQDRWVVSGADTDLAWIDDLATGGSGRRKTSTKRKELIAGLMSLLLCRIFRPSYLFLNSYRPQALYRLVQQGYRPDLFGQLQEYGEATAKGARTRDALVVISKLVLHTGRDVDELTAEDFFAYRAWCLSRVGKIHQAGLSLAWSLLRSVTNHSEHATLRDAVRHGQRPTAELVDNYHLQATVVRDVLVRYLEERRPALDYGSFRGLVGILAGSFWADIERNHPGTTTLHLPEDVAQAWKQRMRTFQHPDGTTRPRRQHLTILTRVRSFYLDLQEWALEDPSWAPWSVPSPVRRGETAGQRKVRTKGIAKVHQRVRERLPHLPALVDAAERHKNDQAELLAAATAAPAGATFEHGGRHYRRRMPSSYTQPHFDGSALPIHLEDLATGISHNLSRDEDEAFWSWAIIETLRHTGLRIEELSELSHLSLVSYRLPAGGEVVPMLHIVPSKSNEERLLLISPELASVLATIITRLRRDNAGHVPLTSRYDSYECVVGPPLPHLFQRRRAWKWDVPSQLSVQRLLNKTLARAGIRALDGQPLRFTPHDFRRMFATEAATGGLPVHIIARLLGHANINTTQAYMAVFDEDLVRAYRGFLDKRRAARPEAEQRLPTEQEWQEFQQHFQTRKLELGECGRPYGTPCKHEHACIRCPSLRLDPSARPRLLAIIANLRDRVEEARLNGWLGEVDGLQTSLQAASAKLVALDRMRERTPAGTVNLGIPIITTD